MTRQNDSALPMFLVYDFCTVVVFLGVFLVRGYLLEYDRPMWYTSFYYVKLLYALFSFPFLVFNLPLWGPALHRANATGYDKEGKLVPKLGDGLIKKKLQNEIEARQGRRCAPATKHATAGRPPPALG